MKKMTLDEYLKDSKLVSEGLYSDKLNNLTSVKIKAINDLNNQIEIVYIKDDDEKYLTIHIFQGFYTYYKCYFELDTQKLDDKLMDSFDFIYDGSENYYYKKPHDILDEISYIHNISYDLYYYDDKDCPKQTQCEQITITANDKNNILKSYTLYFKEDEELSRVFDIKIESIKNSFISKVIDKSLNLVISLSYDENNIYSTNITNSKHNDKTSRLHSPCSVSSLKYNPKEKIELKKDKDSIYLTNLGFNGDGFTLIEKEHYNKLDSDDKNSFDKYSKNLIEFLNNLFMNKTFKYHKNINFEDEQSYKNYIKDFKTNGFIFDIVYIETWHGIPSLEVFSVKKDHIEFKLKISSDIVVDCYVVEIFYDDKYCESIKKRNNLC